MSAPRAVLLDVDGTLVDSNEAHALAYVQACAENGIETRVERVLPLIGMGGDKLLPALLGLDAESETGRRIAERKKEIFQAHHLPGLRPTPGARELLERLRADGRTLVVATSAGEDEMRALLEQAGLADLIEDATSASEVEDSKPEPDVVVSALSKAGARPEEALLLGDTPYDVEAAARAGVAVVAVRCGGWDDRGLGGARAIYDHPADLLAHWDTSPLAG